MRTIPLFLLLSLPLLPQSHPLDGLTAPEYWTVYNTLQQAGHAPPGTLFTSVLLRPPAKASVLAWQPGQPVPRAADVILLRGKQSFLAHVDIASRRVVNHEELKDAQAPFLASELFGAGETIKNDARVIEALKKRGLTDLRMVQCLALPVAYRAVPEQATARIGFGACTLTSNVLHDWGRSIDGLTIQIDMTTKKILKVVDSEVVPVPTADNNYEDIPENPRPHSTPIATSQPLGPGYRINQGEVSWQNWRFRFRLDQRIGTVLNLVRFVDQGRPRSVLHEASVSELFVPYMDPSNGWNNRAFIDAGQFYATSHFLKPLRPGLDCPSHATWFHGFSASETGAPKRADHLAYGTRSRPPGAMAKTARSTAAPTANSSCAQRPLSATTTTSWTGALNRMAPSKSASAPRV